MKLNQSARLVSNIAERKSLFRILTAFFLIILISLIVYFILSYTSTPETESHRLTSHTYSPCIYEGQCSAGQTCKNNFCVLKEDFCYDSADCPIWERCNTETNLCFNKPGKCKTDSECMVGEYCNIETHSCMFSHDLLTN